MTAKPLDVDKFSKVIALAESDEPGEASAALHVMRKMLTDAGINLRDFGEMLRGPRSDGGIGSIHFELQIRGLAKRLREREAEVSRLNREIATWRELAWSNTQELTDSNQKLVAEVEELKARLHSAQTRPRRNADKRAAVLFYLRNPDHSKLSDREIARRAGVSPQTVCNWRKRLYPAAPANPERTFVRAGKSYVMRTGNIGQHRQVG